MKQTTDQERADFEAWARDRYPSIDLTRDRNDYSKALAKDYWSLWQAARRAQGVPQGWRLQDAAQDALDWLEDEDLNLTHNIRERLRFALATAPQPPEAAQLNDTNVVDMAQAVDSKEAAPVQMPKEPTREMLAALLSPEEMSVVDMYKGTGVDALGIAIKVSGVADRYRALLAAHGVK